MVSFWDCKLSELKKDIYTLKQIGYKTALNSTESTQAIATDGKLQCVVISMTGINFHVVEL